MLPLDLLEDFEVPKVVSEVHEFGCKIRGDMDRKADFQIGKIPLSVLTFTSAL